MAQPKEFFDGHPVDETEVEKISLRMYRRRIDQYNEPLKTWNQVRRSDDKRPPRDIIRHLLSKGKRVTAGYFTTGVRGFHEHVIYWK